MSRVLQPQVSDGTQKTLGNIGTIVGGVVGGITGGPGGAVAGAATGNSVGSTAGALLSGGPRSTPLVENKAVERRLEQSANSPSSQLAQAEHALRQLPPEYQQAYGATITAARKRDQEWGGTV